MSQRQQYAITPTVATDEQHSAARDWSVSKYGIGIGIDASKGCWDAMIAAAPPPPDQVLTDEEVAAMAESFKPTLNEYGVPWPPFDAPAFARAIERAVLTRPTEPK